MLFIVVSCWVCGFQWVVLCFRRVVCCVFRVRCLRLVVKYVVFVVCVLIVCVGCVLCGCVLFDVRAVLFEVCFGGRLQAPCALCVLFVVC